MPYTYRFLSNEVGLKKLKLVEVLLAATENVNSIVFETVSETLENVTVLVLGLDFISAFSVETLSRKANFEKIIIIINSNQIDPFGASGGTTNVFDHAND